MFTGVGFLAPRLVAEAFVQGEERRAITLADFRGSWVVISFGVTHLDVLELAELEDSFAADGAVVLAAMPDEWDEIAAHYADEPIRFPILAGVWDSRRITAIIDPQGVIRHVGLRRTARQTLTSLEALLLGIARAA